jgi:hypothetical protein
MRDVKYGRAFAGLLLTIVGLMAGGTETSSQVHNTAAASPAPGSGPQARFSDPFAYCAAVGTIDAPDARYTGPKVPEVVARFEKGLRRARGCTTWTIPPHYRLARHGRSGIRLYRGGEFAVPGTRGCASYAHARHDAGKPAA